MTLLPAVFAAALAGQLVAPPDPTAALAAEMEELGAAETRRRRVAVLVCQGRRPEAEALAAGLSHASTFDATIRRLDLPSDSCAIEPSCWARLARWVLHEAGQPDLSVELFEKAMARGAELSFDARRDLRQAYIEAGRYATALDLTRVLVDQAAWLKPGVPILEQLVAGGLGRLDELQLRSQGGIVSNATRRLLDVWQFRPRNPAEQLERLRLMISFGIGPSTQLARETLLVTPGVTADEAIDNLSKLAEREWGLGHHDEAITQWRRIFDWKPSPTMAASVRFAMAMARKQQGRYEEALALLIPVSHSDQDLSADAVWEMGHIRLRQGDPAGASQAYGRAREHPFPWCCTYRFEADATYHLYAGLCQERLGRIGEAVVHYLRASASFPLSWRVSMGGHLVDLYATAGQLDVLERLFPDPGPEHPGISAIGLGRDSGRRVIHTLIELRRLEERGDWAALVARLPLARVENGPEIAHERSRRWEAMEAARLLARNAEQAIPLLAERLSSTPRSHDSSTGQAWAYVALALTGRAEALTLLREEAQKPEIHVRSLISLLYALGLTAEGRRMLDGLCQDSLLARLVPRESHGDYRGANLTEEFPFPAPASSLELPTALPPKEEPPQLRRQRSKPCFCM